MKPIPLEKIALLMEKKVPSHIVVKGFCIDSRLIKPGELFFAIPGNRVDGHRFLKEVQAKGACAAVVNEDVPVEVDLPLIRVPNVLIALQDLARRALIRRKSKVIGITGSVGKTTTKEFVTTLLKPHFSVFASPASYNSQITLPLSILLADGDEEYLILEMGMTHTGQIAKLVSIAPPEIALLTNTAIQHACNFSDGLAGISREKSAIFSHPQTKLGIMPRELTHFDEVSQSGSCKKNLFSLIHPDTDYYLEHHQDHVKIFEGGVCHTLYPAIPVKALYHNFLASVAVARHLGVSWDSIKQSSQELRLPDMRFQTIVKSGITFINDAYNALPDSMKAALESLPKPQEGGKTVAVLSEMTELGIYSEAGHAAVAEKALQHIDVLFCVGSRCEMMKKVWKREKKPVELFETRQDLEQRLKEVVNPGDVVLLKGARPWSLDQILLHFE